MSQDLVRQQSAIPQEPVWSPADTPPDYNMTHVPWAWQNFEQGEYQQRMKRARTVLTSLHKISSIPLAQFGGERYLDVTSALMTAFGRSTKDYATVDELLQHSALPKDLIQRGIFKDPDDWEPRDLTTLLGTNLSSTTFDVQSYDLLPEALKDYLGINLLLIAQSHNPFRAAIELQPKDFRRPVDERYLQFYERLAEKGIGGVISFSAAKPFLDSWLGIYDRRATNEETRTIFPQYFSLPTLGAAQSSKRSVIIEPWRDYKDKGILAQFRENDTLDEIIKEEIKKGIVKRNNQPDDQLTSLYHDLLDRNCGGSVWWERYAKEAEQINPYLTPEQKMLIGLSVMNGVMMHLRTGQLRNLEDIEDLGTSIHQGFMAMLPQVASKLRLYYEAFKDNPHALETLLHGRSGTYLTDKIYNIVTSRDRDMEQFLPPSEAAKRLRARPRPHFANPELHMPHQETYMEHAVQAVQDSMPGMKVDERIVCEVYESGEILFTALGGNYSLRELGPKTALFIVRFMESNLGCELPRLRTAFARAEKQTTRDAIQQLASYATGRLLEEQKRKLLNN